MNQAGPKRAGLVPEQGIEITVGRSTITSCPAWLAIAPLEELTRHRWVRLAYSASFFDEPVRPLIRFITKAGDTIVQPMNGPMLGSAEWIGRVPDGTVAASISPSDRTGPFAFRLDAIVGVPRTALVARGLGRYPDWLYWAARSRLLNSRREASQALSFATGGTPFDDYAAWHRRFARPVDVDGVDRPRSDWRIGPVFCLVVRLRGEDPAELRNTIQSLRGQIYSRWCLCAVADATTNLALLSAFRAEAATDAHFCEVNLNADQEFFPAGFDRADFFARIGCGDTLPDYALAVIAEAAARSPNFDLVYSDEDRLTPRGDLQSPILKPDWSPVLQSEIGYVGRLTFIRSRLMTEDRLRQLANEEDAAIDDLCRQLAPSAIGHIRRILCHRRSDSAVEKSERTHSHKRAMADQTPLWPDVAVIIPTRNKAALLRECLDGLLYKTDYPDFEIAIVDNGSDQPDAVRFLQEIAREPRVSVLQYPGPFNFSAMSNAGARATRAPVLVFLNNDVAVLESLWLRALVAWAVKPTIGVVGAKLLFPSGRIQHAGTVIGFGGIAGHVYRRLPPNHPGYLSRLTVPHEVAAVTGACIAVERSKFDAVGGFDAEHLPVDLNDMDLCLRIAEAGWSTVWTPEATLLHHQSATRGIDSDPFELYRQERAYFVRRWSHVIRDDPYFHPALSLHAHDLALA